MLFVRKLAAAAVLGLSATAAALPAAAQDYLKFLSDYLEVPVSMVSTGASREETIRL